MSAAQLRQLTYDVTARVVELALRDDNESTSILNQLEHSASSAPSLQSTTPSQIAVRGKHLRSALH